MPMTYFRVSDEKYQVSSEALTLSVQAFGILKHTVFWDTLSHSSKFKTRNSGEGKSRASPRHEVLCRGTRAWLPSLDRRRCEYGLVLSPLSESNPSIQKDVPQSREKRHTLITNWRTRCQVSLVPPVTTPNSLHLWSCLSKVYPPSLPDARQKR